MKRGEKKRGEVYPRSMKHNRQASRGLYSNAAQTRLDQSNHTPQSAYITVTATVFSDYSTEHSAGADTNTHTHTEYGWVITCWTGWSNSGL